MKVMKKFGICLILCALVSSWALAQKGPQTWDFVPTPEYKKAERLCLSGHLEEGILKFREIANNNPGTALAAQCQAVIAEIYHGRSDKEKAIREYSDIAAKYPGSGWELGSREYIIDLKYGSDYDTWLAKTDELITSVGGKSIYEIIGLRSSSNRGSPQNIPQGYKNSVSAMYGDVGASLMGYNITSGKNDSNKLDQAYKMLTYVRENFPAAPCSTTVSGEIRDIFSEWGFSGTGADTKSPTIKIITPLSILPILWRKPVIRVFMYDGDINQSQIDLANLEFKLDGVDLKDKMKIKICTLRPRTKLDAKRIVEKIFVWYRPETPLANGSHTVTVKATDYAGNSATAKVTFKVTSLLDIEDDSSSWIDKIINELLNL